MLVGVEFPLRLLLLLLFAERLLPLVMPILKEIGLAEDEDGGEDVVGSLATDDELADDEVE